jgi:hypothetical protein
MNLSEANRFYQELRAKLDNHLITQADFDQKVNELRVLGPDNVWWQIRATDGVWFRWDGQAWNQAKPPESNDERQTELGFYVEALPSSVENLENKPQNIPSLRILRGEPALAVLQNEKMVREIFTKSGPRYQILNPKPKGAVQGIAFHLKADGYLDPDIAIEVFGDRSPILQKLTENSELKVSTDSNSEQGKLDSNRVTYKNATDQSEKFHLAEIHANPSHRFLLAIEKFTQAVGDWLPNNFDLSLCQRVAKNLIGTFERDYRQIEIPALGPMAGEALAWWHLLINNHPKLASPAVSQCLNQISRRYMILEDQPPLYLAVSRLQKNLAEALSNPSTESAIPLNAIYLLILSNPEGLEKLRENTFPSSWPGEDPLGDKPSQGFPLDNPMYSILRIAAYNRMSASLSITKSLIGYEAGNIVFLDKSQRNFIVKDLVENCQKTVEQLSAQGDPYILGFSHMHLAAGLFDLTKDPGDKQNLLREHIAAAIQLSEKYANHPEEPVLWLNTQILPWGLLLLSIGALAAPSGNNPLFENQIIGACNLLLETYNEQHKIREKATYALFIGRAAIDLYQQVVDSAEVSKIKLEAKLALQAGFHDFILAGDLHMANECQQLIKLL